MQAAPAGAASPGCIAIQAHWGGGVVLTSPQEDWFGGNVVQAGEVITYDVTSTGTTNTPPDNYSGSGFALYRNGADSSPPLEAYSLAGSELNLHGTYTIPAGGLADFTVYAWTSSISPTATVTATVTCAAPTTPPTVSGISPTAGPTSGGTSVVITGTNFSSVTGVTFGATPATGFTVNSSTRITATAPAGSSGTVDVRVTTAGGTSATSAADQFTYVAAPTVTAISPASGPTSGGTTVVITGTNLTGATAVTFGGTAATSFTVYSGTQITATAPADVIGTVDVRVTTVGGTSATSAADRYTYAAPPTVTAISPASGPTSGGTTVVITGTNLNGATGVIFGGTWATSFTVNSSTQITATAPSGSGLVDVRVTTAGGSSATSAADQYTYIGAPTVTSISPKAGATSGGTAIDINGTNFTGATAVTFGGTAATGFTVISGTQITATSPANAAGTVDVRVTTTGGTSATSAADQFTFIAPLMVSPASGALPGGTVATAYSQTFTASGGTAPYAFSASGTLPTGLTLSAGGVLSGTPTASGTFNFMIEVSDSSAALIGSALAASTAYSITITKASQTISFANPGTQLFGTSPTLTATATSGLTVTFTSSTTAICTVSGATLTFIANGTCTINADQAGDAAYSAAPTVSQSFTVTPAPLTITPAAATGLKVGASYSQQNTASGGTSPYTYSLSAGAFVPGTSIDSGTGTVAGTPTVAGSFSYIVRVTDSQPLTATTPVTTVTIAKGDQTIGFTSTVPAATVGGTPYAVSANASSGLGVTFALDGASTGCTLSGNTVTFTSTGTCTINANQAGDFNWNAAPQAQQSFAVDAASAVTATLDFSPTPLGAGDTGTATITFSNPNASATPAVAPLLAGSALLTRTGAIGGSCGATGADAGANVQFNAFQIPSGICTVTLAYTGAVAGSSAGMQLGAFTPSGYPTTPATAGNAFAVLPTITDVSPNSGPVSQVVTISGTGFSTTPGNNSVLFGGSAGTVTAASATSLTVTAPATGSGAASVTVTVNGQTSTGGATYTFIDKPVAADMPGVAVAYNSGGTAIDLSASISGGAHTSIAVGTAPTHGSTAIVGDVVTYTPATGYFGADSFTYTASGPGGTSNVATVGITVATPPAPVAADRSGVPVPFNSPGVAIDLSASITGVHTSIAIASAPAHGTTSVAGDVVTYTPANNYAGADSFTYTATGPGGTSAPATVGVQVAKGGQTIAFANPGPQVYGVSATLSATASSGLTVSFSSATPAVCTVTSAGSLSLVGTGTCTINANQAGDASYEPAPEVSQSFVVSAAVQVITGFVANPANPVYAPNGTFSVTATPGASTSPVVFASTSPSVCTVNASTVTMLSAGNCSLTANQGGDANYTAAPQVALDVVIGAATPAITWGGAIHKTEGEAAFELPEPTSTSPGGFTYASSNPAVATVSGRTVTITGPGAAILTATQAATANYTAGAASLELTVGARPNPTSDPSVGEALQAQVDASLRFAQAQQGNVLDRLRQLRHVAGTPSSQNLRFNATSLNGGLSLPLGAASGSQQHGFGVWTAGNIILSQHDGRPGRNGFDLRSDGVTLGADRAFGDFVFGGAVGAGWSDADFADERSGQDATQKAFTAYGLWRGDDHWYMDGLMGWGRLDFDLSRWSTTANALATARRKGDQLFGALSVGYTRQGGSMELTGYGRLEASRTTLDAYRESGLGIYDLAYREQSIDDSAVALGVEGRWRMRTIRPYWSLEYRDALRNGTDAAINYVIAPAAGDSLLGLRSIANRMWTLGAGFDVQLASGWQVSFQYRREQASDMTGNSVGLRFTLGSLQPFGASAR